MTKFGIVFSVLAMLVIPRLSQAVEGTSNLADIIHGDGKEQLNLPKVIYCTYGKIDAERGVYPLYLRLGKKVNSMITAIYGSIGPNYRSLTIVDGVITRTHNLDTFRNPECITGTTVKQLRERKNVVD